MAVEEATLAVSVVTVFRGKMNFLSHLGGIRDE